MKKKKNDAYYKLEKGYVRNFEEKIKNIGRPSVFIGSSAESISIVDKVKALFPIEEFEVDTWYDGVFGVTKSEDEVKGLSNMEWLTNFTDIYDYAIFLFLPEDMLKSKLRRDNDGELKTAYVTRHNVVFEFGMFLGKIGAKRCFILMEDKNTDPFINDFFSDLKENLDDDKIDFNESFKIEIHKYEGNYNASLEDEKLSPVDEESMRLAVENIKNHIKMHFDIVELSFLPGTSLAIGYFNNFLSTLTKGIGTIRDARNSFPESFKDWSIERVEDEVILAIQKAETLEIRIVIPNSLEGAKQENFTKDFGSKTYFRKLLPGIHRPLSVICDRNSIELDNSNFIIYDIPTTMNSSIDAINRINPRSEIRELLKMKEVRNFKRALEQLIDEASQKEETKDIKNYIKIIDLEEFEKVVKGLEEVKKK